LTHNCNGPEAAGAVPRRRIAVIFNPTAGWRRRGRLDRVLSRLDWLGCTVDLLLTEAPGHAERLARGLGPDIDAVVVAGGDGTINEVVNGLGPAAPPLGIVPLGTANVLALELGLGRTTAQIAETIVNGDRREIAIGQVNGRRFVQMVGVGADAHIVAHVSKRIKKYAGKGAYVLSGAIGLFTYRFPRFDLVIDGERLSATSVIVSNGRYYGGKNIVAPRAGLDRRSFEVCLMTRSGRYNALRYGLAVFLDRLPALNDVRYITATDVHILAPVGDPMQGDGDLVASLPADITLLPRGFPVLVPARR
jgi:YegS/Rv2252/BmrU family lipid kinase